MSTEGEAAAAARAAFREQAAAKGHAVDNARSAVAGLEAAFAAGTLQRTPVLGAMLADLAVALDAGEGETARWQERGGGAVHPPGDLA